MTDRTPTAPAGPAVREDADDQQVLSRRQSLKAMGKYAAYVAPAMVVLVNGAAEAAPNCDNPGLHLGVSRHGHSGC